MDPLSLVREVLTQMQYLTQPFFMCLSFVLLFDRFAARFGLLDHPDDRKRHEGSVPLVGGVAIYLATSLSIIVFVPHSITALFLLVAGFVLLLGMIDDRYDLPVRYRVLAQIFIAYLTAAYGGVEIHRIGNLIGFGVFELDGVFALAFSMICIVGVINAVNMIDGVDGLAASIAAVTLAGLCVLCFMGDYHVGSRMTMIFLGALLAFLIFNSRAFLPRARIFLGDGGSTLLGFVLAWFFISLTQSDDRYVSPVVAGWLFGLPLIDTVSVMVRRVTRGLSPMTGGRDHLHHRLLDSGMSVNRTVLTMIGLHAVLVATGVLANGSPALEPFLFLGFVGIVLVYHAALPILLGRLHRTGHGLHPDPSHH